MTRPLERLGIDALEAFFNRIGATDEELLNLKEELEVRATHRARTLLEKLNRRLTGVQGVSVTKPHVPLSPSKLQIGLPLEVPIFTGGARQPKEMTAAVISELRSLPELAIAKPSLATADIALSREQAFRVLKVPVTASWEQIEQSRRDLVAKSQPDRLVGLTAEKRKALQEECRMVNGAYGTLVQAKA